MVAVKKAGPAGMPAFYRHPHTTGSPDMRHSHRAAMCKHFEVPHIRPSADAGAASSGGGPPESRPCRNASYCGGLWFEGGFDDGSRTFLRSAVKASGRRNSPGSNPCASAAQWNPTKKPTTCGAAGFSSSIRRGTNAILRICTDYRFLQLLCRAFPIRPCVFAQKRRPSTSEPAIFG